MFLGLEWQVIVGVIVGVIGMFALGKYLAEN